MAVGGHPDLAEQLQWGWRCDAEGFRRSHSFAELLATLGVTGLVAVEQVAMTDLTEAERAAFLADLTTGT